MFVVPPGSRIGTGRINFRLLAREAETRGLGLALVSGDAQVRALAASAGLPVFATVSESEAAEANGTLLAGVAATSAAVGATSLTAGPTSSTAPGPLPGSGGATALPDARWVTDGSEQKAAARRPRRVSRRVGMTVRRSCPGDRDRWWWAVRRVCAPSRRRPSRSSSRPMSWSP